MLKFFRNTRQKLHMKNKFSTYVKYAIGEIVLVVIGILIALYINNWNEKSKVQESVKTSIKMIRDEVATNQNKINAVQDYHIMVRDTLRRVNLPDNTSAIGKAIGFWKGMQTPTLQDAAFQSSIQSGVAKEIDPMLLKALNNLYAQQNSYNDFTSQSAQIFFETDFTDGNSLRKAFGKVQMTMNELTFYEKGLIDNYSSSLKILDSIYKGKK